MLGGRKITTRVVKHWDSLLREASPGLRMLKTQLGRDLGLLRGRHWPRWATEVAPNPNYSVHPAHEVQLSKSVFLFFLPGDLHTGLPYAVYAKTNRLRTLFTNLCPFLFLLLYIYSFSSKRLKVTDAAPAGILQLWLLKCTCTTFQCRLVRASAKISLCWVWDPKLSS